MKRKLKQYLSLILAVVLQFMPLVRSALPSFLNAVRSPLGAVIARWAVGGTAIFGFHAISSATSIAISPANATVGQPYVGTVTYSGGHAGSVSSMSLSNICLGSTTPLIPGLTIVYSGLNTATVSGTPTATNTYAFTLKIYDSSGCGNGGNTDTRTTSLVVGPSTSTGVGAAITSPPQGVTAQVGADALLTAAASGTPAPSYFWYRGIPNIASNLVGVGSTLDFPSVQLTNSGLYTVVASNAYGQDSAPAYLSVALTPGANPLALNYTNYYMQGIALTMSSFLTNVSTASNTYKWQFNSVDITAFSTNGYNLNLTAAQVIPSKSGKYGVVFNSVVGTNTVVPQQLYYSYWAFGLPPVINAPPQGTNANAGATVVLTATGTNVSVPAITAALPYYGSNTPLTFQWYLNGTNLVATQTTNGLVATESLVLNSVSAANAGNYTIVVSNYWGAVTSSPAAVTITGSSTAPVITGQPAPASVLAGKNASFTVTASGTAPLSYQWLQNGSNLANGGVYSGVNTNMLILTGAGTNNAGNYSVMVTNMAGSTNSASVPLSVSLPPSLGVAFGANGLQLSASTLSGIPYVVQTTTNLNSPWSSLATNVVPSNGIVTVTNSALIPQQYFRLQFP